MLTGCLITLRNNCCLFLGRIVCGYVKKIVAVFEIYCIQIFTDEQSCLRFASKKSSDGGGE